MKSEFKKQTVFLLVIILIVMCIVTIGLWGYKYLTTDKEELNKNIKLVCSTDTINIKDTFPMSDDMGINMKYDEDNKDVQSYLECEVTNNNDVSVNYEIFSTMENKDDIHPNYIRMYLTDEDGKELFNYNDKSILSYYNLRGSDVRSGAKKIYSSKLNKNSSKKFILRTWVSDAYSIGIEDKNIEIKLYAEAE